MQESLFSALLSWYNLDALLQFAYWHGAPSDLAAFLRANSQGQVCVWRPNRLLSSHFFPSSMEVQKSMGLFESALSSSSRSAQLLVQLFQIKMKSDYQPNRKGVNKTSPIPESRANSVGFLISHMRGKPFGLCEVLLPLRMFYILQCPHSLGTSSLPWNQDLLEVDQFNQFS